MAKLTGEMSETCQLQDPRTLSNNSQDPICETSGRLHTMRCGRHPGGETPQGARSWTPQWPALPFPDIGALLILSLFVSFPLFIWPQFALQS